MSRREEARTDRSVISVTESLKSLMATGLRYAGELAGLTFLDDAALQQGSTEQLLHRMLSTKSYISATSSHAENQFASKNPSLRAFTQIGKGQCGTVWALTGEVEALKVMNDGKMEQLANDYRNHAIIEDAFRQTFSQFRRNVNLPRVLEWVSPHNELFWNDVSKLFPYDIQPTCCMLSDRILPLPLPVRSLIVDAFAPKHVKDNKDWFLSQPENKDCLIRLYLGRRQERSTTNTFRLRNFDMTVNELERLQLDTGLYAETMAQTLAIIHWKAGLDANDIEFVFGSSPRTRLRPTGAELREMTTEDLAMLSNEVEYGLDFRHRSIAVWVLDFDQCKPFQEDANGLKQLERGFYFNDPYYPRPYSRHANDAALWRTFKDSYLATSAALTTSAMPEQFISAVEAEGRKRSAGGSLFN